MFQKLTKNLKKRIPFKNSGIKMRNEGNFDGRFSTFLVFVIALAFFLFLFESFSITGNATEGSTISNVSIAKYLAISFSSNLSEGILFGNVAALPSVDINATHNYDGTSGGSSFFISVSNDSNTAIDFCIKANAGLTSAASDVIGLGNETYSNSTSTNSTIPPLTSQTALTTAYVKSGVGVAVGSNEYWRFWLDIPAAQPSGDYNNSVSFKGVVSGVSC